MKLKQITRTTLTGNEKLSEPTVSSSSFYEERSKSDIGEVENPTVPPSSDGSSDNNIIPNNKNIDILSDLELEPMALETFKIDF